MTHPIMVGNVEGKMLPVHGFEVTEDVIDDAEGGFQIRVSLAMFGSHDRMPLRWP